MKRNRMASAASGSMLAQAATQDVAVERRRQGEPHKGRVFAAVHAHCHEVPYFAAGLCSKLMSEGYVGYVIRTSNDQLGGGQTIAENILSNQQEHSAMASALGFKDVFDLYYRQSRMNGISSTDLRGRLVLIFRMLKVDTVLTFNPWAFGEEDPDRWVTGRAAAEACAISGIENEYPEYLEAGIAPYSVSEQYYFYTGTGQLFNRVVDVSSQIEKKIDAIVECKTQGGGNSGSLLRARLAKRGRSLALLGRDDRTADRGYVRQFLLEENRQYGRAYKFSYAERFYYVDRRKQGEAKIDEFVDKNAVGLR